MIDSEQVPRGKGEKQPGEGDEIVPETICLQGSGASTLSLRAPKFKNKKSKCKMTIQNLKIIALCAIPKF